MKMTFKDLPKSLVEASKGILDDSMAQYSALVDKYTHLGLKRFGVKRESQLCESDRKALSAWVQVKLEESCACQLTNEDCMPNDEVFYTSSGEKRKEFGSENEDEKELDEVIDMTKGSEDEAIKRAIDDFVKSDAPQFSGKSKDERIDMAIAAVNAARGTSTSEEVEAEKETEELKEGIAIEPDEVHTNGAVAAGSVMKAEPIHADVLRDCSPTDGKKEYRILLQYATHNGIKIYPEMPKSGASTLDELKSLAKEMPFYNKKVEDAIEAAKGAERE
jgi:hypothetical protein